MGSLTSTIDHGSLTGLGDDDHTQYVLHTEVDDTPANGATTDPVSSNWAFDHEAAADPHTGYRLESADHSHQSAGAQAGQLDHGLALTGLTDDDHTQYVLRSILTTRGDLPVRGASDWTRLGVGAANTVLTANGTDPAWSATPTVTTLTTTGLLTAGDGLTVSAGTVTLPANSLVVGTTQLVTTATGVGIGEASPAVKLDVVGPELRMRSVTTNAVVKSGVLTLGHYTNAEENVLGIYFESSLTQNAFNIGGGVGGYNAATSVNFRTAANNTTLIGTLRLIIDSSGNLILGGATAVGTSAAAVLGLANGTAPSTAPANLTQLWSADIGGAAGKASLLMMSESGTGVQTVVGAITKATTGDPAQVHESLVVINEFDNNIRMYADGAYRTLATW